MNKIIYAIPLLFFGVIGKSQGKETDWTSKIKKIDSLLKINYMDREYDYLDEEFKLLLSDTAFSSINRELKEGKTYQDSLFIVLKEELCDEDEARIAFHQMLYNWKRLSWYIWESPERSQELASKFGFEHPGRFIFFLRYGDDNSEKIQFLNALRQKLEAVSLTSLPVGSNEELLNHAFEINPEKISAERKAHKKNCINH